MVYHIELHFITYSYGSHWTCYLKERKKYIYVRRRMPIAHIIIILSYLYHVFVSSCQIDHAELSVSIHDIIFGTPV